MTPHAKEDVERVAEALWDWNQENGATAFTNHLFFGVEWMNKRMPWSEACSPKWAGDISGRYRSEARAALDAMAAKP